MSENRDLEEALQDVPVSRPTTLQDVVIDTTVTLDSGVWIVFPGKFFAVIVNALEGALDEDGNEFEIPAVAIDWTHVLKEIM